ncbi:bacillithiol biosynthesis cysteine-adding enzyme BshC [Leeuwenhoekiella marinoflava]|uniref:Putative cysteine ligase BshC n=2 Tax=Leeuwenhoekiella marinoflava TaxID=988 RepID=A0A4Q0PKP6_9FLAO|nr:bacillithiol biosynthesis cysteine-adding enzyme BshC [Leeuwenhoekiella marinoflava]RXG29022.1 bacillithiol biosynthesis cysteine-adding enzyme BshC [Leeuwenhoekiella marinoflava]SHF45724.1 bacillithiol biosynthesis cysteine-adding enzyme BshC [Leeuwenhoekiella marinoflava DSM 3653]
MSIHKIAYKETGYFSKLICDYLEEHESLNQFYGNFPTLENFKKQLEAKSFSQEKRSVLVSALQNQYKNLELGEAVESAIEQLEQENTFTVTTGHQLNLFTGPLYFLYKIISTITLSRKLKEAYPDHNFVPVYWMATEDHDFDEINYFRLHGKKIQWNREDIQNNDKGAVGALKTEGLQEVFNLICAELGNTQLAKELCDLFESAYLKYDTLTEATRYLAHRIFSQYGLVIVDGDDHQLKLVFAPYMKQEILENKAHKAVSTQAEKLEKSGYSVQVNAREINLFYLSDGIRERIIEKEGRYFINDTSIEFSKEELLAKLEETPEAFSPNVIMRPLYQEVILPNLAYIGGGGEIAYWLELKSFFDAVEVPFPMLMVRNSALLITEKQQEKLEKLHVSIEDLFLNQNDLVNRKIRKISNIDVDFSPQKKHLVKQFEDLYTLASETDASFLGAVKAQEVKQLKGLDHLEKRLLKAQKKKLGDHVKRLTDIQNELFPLENLQERIMNFSEFYLEYGSDLIPQLFDSLDPLDYKFTVITK